ncbi:MAG: SpoIIE family protein phosphatase [Clostridium sp.]
MREIFDVFTEKKQFKKLLILSFLIFLESIPYKKAFMIMPMTTRIMPLNSISPVIGMFFGPIGAWSMAFGNLAAEFVIVGKLNYKVLLLAFSVQFFYTYVPYKMWYTVGVKEKCEFPSLEDVKSISKYIYITLINSIIAVLLLELSYRLCGIFEINLRSLFLLTFNTFTFPIIVGIPLMIILSSTRLKRYIPKAKKSDIPTERYTNLIHLTIILGVCNLIYCENYGYGDNKITIVLLLFAIYSLLLVYVILPISKTINLDKKTSFNNRVSMKGKTTIAFLIIGIVFIVFIAIAMCVVLKILHYNDSSIFNLLCIMIGVCTVFVFIVTLLALNYMENKMTIPLETLFNAVKLTSNIGDDYDTEEELKAIELCKNIKSGNEIEELAIAFSSMIDKINNYCKNLAEITEERKRGIIELSLAVKIQESILPRKFPAFPDRADFEIFADMTPAKNLGGDFYDFFLIDDNKLCFVVADVSGKGIPAALFMMSARAIIKNLVLITSDVLEIVKELNTQLNQGNETYMFVSAFISIIDLQTGIMTFVSAGHNPPLIKKEVMKNLNI